MADYKWTRVLQAPVDESYFGPNDPRNHYDPISGNHPLPGSVARRNGGYAWGVTTYKDEIWYGAFMNGWCHWLQPAGLPGQTAATMEFYNYRSENSACNISEKNRQPVIHIFNPKSRELKVYQSSDPRFSKDMEGVAALKVAATFGDLIFFTALLAGSSVAVGDIKSDETHFFSGLRVFAINGATGAYLGSSSFARFNETRRMLALGHPDGTEGLYLAVSNRSGQSHLLRWTGSPDRPFPGEGEDGAGFEVAIDNSGQGLLGEIRQITDAGGNKRLLVSAWSSAPQISRSGGLYVSRAMPADGFRNAGPEALKPLMLLDRFDPDPLLGPTWGGGILEVFGKYAYWGTMTLGFLFAGVYADADPQAAATPDARDNIARSIYARAAHLFRFDLSDLDQAKPELVFGNEYFPVYDAKTSKWTHERNRLGLKPMLGSAGFGYGTNCYAWESIVHNGKLFVGTMDYSGGLVDYVENSTYKSPDYDWQIHANYRVAKEQGFMPGGDMLVFENTEDQPVVITRSGLDNPNNNGFRNFLEVGGRLYVGTSSEANVGPDSGYMFYEYSG